MEGHCDFCGCLADQDCSCGIRAAFLSKQTGWVRLARHNTFRPDAISIWAYASLAALSVPMLILLFYGLVVYRSPLGFSLTVLQSIALTLFASAAAATLVFLLFTPAAYHLSRRSNDVLETAADLPASIPHPIVGISLLLLDSRTTPVGSFLQSIGVNFFYSVQGLIIALVVVSAPIYIRAAQSLFAARSQDSELFAASLGASRLRILYSVIVPSSARDLLSASLTSMGRAMSEFGSVAIIAYFVLQPPFSGVRPASVLVYEYFGYYGTAVAVSASSFMVLFSVALMVAVRLVRRKSRIRSTVAGD